ncbi:MULTISPECIES: hypothetical protein [unclassified Treponema]|uniref:hypothetical protein n=1 Tax=unclassified Treponema TaxID=2638727 RepID=UPI0020A31FE1|nr:MULTISPECIES: hypothetical protein [unclassified Treponema]UTC66001.1 hypothetical protein E4O06_08185 [Treponema sp. OMZ 789]UTC68731.1 hypothetical protein E4O01_08325 [Treponema sp. OMZ 790]UTC71460.1 hypothetical protein E4O02_08515 [Treponema sp. OMZ 791]
MKTVGYIPEEKEDQTLTGKPTKPTKPKGVKASKKDTTEEGSKKAEQTPTDVAEPKNDGENSDGQ